MWQNKIVGYGEESPDQLLANPHNHRIHPKRQQFALKGSLDTLGYIQTVIVNKTTGHIIDGHLRAIMALRNDQDMIPVTYVELSPEEEAQALLSLDPIAAMATNDAEKVDELLRMIDTDNADVMKHLADFAESNKLLYGEQPEQVDAEPEIDISEKLREKWGVELGQMWLLGNHRIICGDCTDESIIDKLLGDEKAEICWTDPPWNVAYGKTTHPHWKQRNIVNDDLGDNFGAFAENFCKSILSVLKPGGILYMVMSAQEWGLIMQTLEETGFHWSSTIIWNKDHLVLSRKDYHTKYEPMWYGWKDDAPRLKPLTDRQQSDVWDIDRPTRSVEHPTMKPIELIERSLNNSSDVGNIVFEPFSGSGSTIIACENTNRRCRAVEISPAYVAVAIERWNKATGKLPEIIKS